MLAAEIAMLDRRHLLKNAALAAAALPAAAAPYAPRTAQTALPRWRGFNLLDLFQALPVTGRYPAPTSEEECKWMRDWGFNFIRIPVDYWFWIDTNWLDTKTLTADDMFKIRESGFETLDRLVEMGRRYGLHVNINLHRAPGYCINNNEREPANLWKDPRAEEAFTYHWEVLARRYRGVTPLDLSFNLVNEAPSPREGFMDKADYYRVMTRAAGKIREISPTRLILIDGYGAGSAVADNLVSTGLHQSVHAYWPARISHFRAGWVDRKMDFPDPAWPILREDGSEEAGRAEMEARMAAWADIARQGIGVHCGEYGCYNRTPHAIALAWMTDVLECLEMHGIGWAMWNFRGTFGILDSGRQDVDYEDWYGLKLDRKLLALIQRY
jgi:aryl-phospho-beta-D-glucosidase BglC (GH1 family)